MKNEVCQGRIVRYVTGDGENEPVVTNAAIITDAPNHKVVNLAVFARSAAESTTWGEGVRHIDGVPYDPTKAPGTWHWHSD